LTALPAAAAPTPALTGVSDGAAGGIGFFFLRLNHVTMNPACLGKAMRAADHIAPTQHPSDAASELVQSPGLASPVASRTPESSNPISAMTAGRFSE